jgi:hypothetical protein
MKGQRRAWWLGVVLVMLLGSSCSGVLMETQQEDGRVNRFKFDGGESWSTYDDKPRYPKTKTPLDDMCIMLKKEATF